MNEGSSGNVSTTAPTRGSAAPSTPPNNNNKPDAKHPAEPTEAQFLDQQAQQAKDALSRTLSLIGKNLGQSVDPRAWAQEHPWLTLAGAAVGGFVAACAVVPTKEDQAIKRLARIERAIAPKPPVVVAADGDSDRHPANKGVVHGLLNQVLKSIQPAIMSAITAGITAKVAKEPDPPANDPNNPAASSGAGYPPGGPTGPVM